MRERARTVALLLAGAMLGLTIGLLAVNCLSPAAASPAPASPALDANLDVCPPAIQRQVKQVPEVPALRTQDSLPAVQQVAATYHYERRCGPNGCTLVSVPDNPPLAAFPSPARAPDVAAPARQTCFSSGGECSRPRRPAIRAVAAVAGKLRIFKRLRGRH